jgi:hypothetical protein
MSNESDIELEQAMVNALAVLKQSEMDLEKKNNNKYWAELTLPFTLHDGLSKYTKAELDEIRKYLDIKRASSLRKPELILRIQEALPLLLEELCLNLDEERFNLLSNMARNGGYINAPKLEHEQISYLRATGVVYVGKYNGKKVLALPTELIDTILSLTKVDRIQEIIKRNTEWIKLSHGLLYYYGTLDINNLIDLLEKYTEKPLLLREYLIVMHDANTYRMEHTVGVEGYSNRRVFDPKKVKQEHRMRDGVSYYPFTKQKLLTAGESGFVDRNECYLKMVQFILGKYEIDKAEADSIVEECVYAIRIGHAPNEIFEYLGTRLEFKSMESVQAMMAQVIHVMNHTRQWFLKGYAPIELGEQEKPFLQSTPTASDKKLIHTGKKIGRNKPCTCGSGKKYKKCCGR